MFRALFGFGVKQPVFGGEMGGGGAPMIVNADGTRSPVSVIGPLGQSAARLVAARQSGVPKARADYASPQAQGATQANIAVPIQPLPSQGPAQFIPQSVAPVSQQYLFPMQPVPQIYIPPLVSPQQPNPLNYGIGSFMQNRNMMP